MWRESNGQQYNQPIERGEGGDGICWTLNGRRWTAYRTRPNGNRQYPEGFICNLSSVGHGSRVSPPTMYLVVCPNPQCQSLVRYGVQVLLLCQFEVGLCLKLAASWLTFVHPASLCSSCTYSICDLCRRSYYDSHCRHRWNRTERKIKALLSRQV